MLIHHYTNLETLAMILNTRKLKFNRLDCVDDLEEGGIQSDGVRLGQYVFVSCWTENAEESIPLWKMYACGENGIRISVDLDMFQDYLITDLNLPNGMRSQGALISKRPKEELVNPNYFILPVFNNAGDMFYRKIEYVEDVVEATNSIVQRTMTDSTHANVGIAFAKVGKYKHKRWAFQEETRFAITILPANPFMMTNPEDVGTVVINSLYNHLQLPFTSYFMRLKQSALNKMTITLNPSATKAQYILAEALCEKYAPGATVKESALAENVKLK